MLLRLNFGSFLRFSCMEALLSPIEFSTDTFETAKIGFSKSDRSRGIVEFKLADRPSLSGKSTCGNCFNIAMAVLLANCKHKSF